MKTWDKAKRKKKQHLNAEQLIPGLLLFYSSLSLTCFEGGVFDSSPLSLPVVD